MKYILVRMPDKTTWRIPAIVVADDRARYYAQVDANSAASEDSSELWGQVYQIS